MNTIEGTCQGVELDKRTYLPGVILKSTCPKCGTVHDIDLGDQYLSYPVVGTPKTMHFECFEEVEGEECGEEWSVDVIVRMSLELAPAG